MTIKLSLHQKVTSQIIEAMQNSTGFVMPWNTDQGLPENAYTKKSYNGINILSLWAAGMQKDYASSQWATYSQWREIGGQVRRGQRGSTIIIYKPLVDDDDLFKCNADPAQRQRVLIRSASVFNRDQVYFEDQANAEKDIKPPLDKTKILNHVDSYIKNTGAEIISGGNRAYYDVIKDLIKIPGRNLFTGTATSNPTEAYYSTLLHELSHWTAKADRCDRDLSGRFKSESYAMEELIAELSAAFLCAELNITNIPRQDHADYLSSWIKVLKDDDKAIFFAAARASEAVAYLDSLQFKVAERQLQEGVEVCSFLKVQAC